MYKIGMFSKLASVTVKTLHYYDEVGLLPPAHVDTESGYRYYTGSQLFRLNEIMALRQMGFSIGEISAVVDGHNIEGIIKTRRAELETEAKAAAEKLFRLNHYIKEWKEGKRMDYQAVVKEIPSYTVYSAKFVLQSYSELKERMPALEAKVRSLNPGIKFMEPDYCYNIYPDGEYREKDIHVEICQAVTAPGKDADGIVFKTIPPAMVVSVLHRGSYETLSGAYAYAVRWVEENGYEIADHIRESYIDGVWNKKSVGEWLTEIQVPVKQR